MARMLSVFWTMPFADSRSCNTILDLVEKSLLSVLSFTISLSVAIFALMITTDSFYYSKRQTYLRRRNQVYCLCRVSQGIDRENSHSLGYKPLI